MGTFVCSPEQVEAEGTHGSLCLRPSIHAMEGAELEDVGFLPNSAEPHSEILQL